MKTRDRPSTLTGGQAAPSGTPRRTRGRGPRQERAVTWLFLLPALIYIALFFGYPIVKNAIMGSQDYTTATFYTGSAPWVGWANYSSFLTSSLAGTTFLNTAVFTVGSIAGQFTIGLAIALFFRRCSRSSRARQCGGGSWTRTAACSTARYCTCIWFTRRCRG